MSTATVLAPDPARRTALAGSGKVTLTSVIKSEWIKFRTLRSSWITIAATIAAMIVIGLVIGYTTGSADWSALEADDRAATAPLRGYFVAQLIIGVLGVLFVTGEYATGMIRSTFAAVPRRLPVVGAKAVVFGLVALVATAVASFAAFFGAQIFLSAEGHGSSIGDSGVLRAVLGVGVYLTCTGLIGGALGWIVRSTAGAISALVGILLIVPVLVQFIPGSVGNGVNKFLPGEAGQAFLTTEPLDNTLAPWAGLGVLVLWAVLAFAIAVRIVLKRDA